MNKALFILNDIFDRLQNRGNAIVIRSLFNQSVPEEDDRTILLSIIQNQGYIVDTSDQYTITIHRKESLRNEIKKAIS